MYNMCMGMSVRAGLRVRACERARRRARAVEYREIGSLNVQPLRAWQFFDELSHSLHRASHSDRYRKPRVDKDMDRHRTSEPPPL